MNETNDVKIKDIVFLTPARVVVDKNGVEQEWIVHVDFVNRKVFNEQFEHESSISEMFFNHLDSINSLPDNLFEAPSHVVDRAAEMQAEQSKVMEQVGVKNG